MQKRAVRKSVVATPDEEFQIDTYLAKHNRARPAGQRKYSFNSLVLDAIKEKIAREKAAAKEAA